MPLFLLDTNIVISLLDATHTQHYLAKNWFISKGSKNWATCPLVELGALRILLNPGYSNPQTNAATVVGTISAIKQKFAKGYSFLKDELEIDNQLFNWQKLIGHKQVTDYYLINLCRLKKAKLATLDKKLIDIGSDFVEMLF